MIPADAGVELARFSSRRYAILTDGFLNDRHAKTAHGVMQYGRDEIVAVVDRAFEGKRVSDVLPHLGCRAPIVADVGSALHFTPTALLVGVAPQGGALPAEFRAHILAAIDAGLEIVSGLHQLLNGDAEFVARAATSGARLWDVRVPPTDIRLFSGAALASSHFITLAVGTDCAIGKMSVMLELGKAGRAAGARPEFIATGQTGIMIAGKGIAVDRVISDFVTGAAEQLVLDASPDADVLLVEGQGSIIHPAYAPVTLGLLFGCAPDALVMCHDCARSAISGYGVRIPDLASFIRLHDALLADVKPAPVVAIALNTSSLDEPAARSAISEVESQTGLPADDAVRFGGAKLWSAIARAAAATPKRGRSPAAAS